jgi:hypothetical protein
MDGAKKPPSDLDSGLGAEPFARLVASIDRSYSHVAFADGLVDAF